MKVKCIAKYQDTQLKRLVVVGDEFEADEARAKVLLDAKVVELVNDEVTKPAAKKKTKKQEE